MSSSDAPRPPGGPLRDDQPDGPMAPGEASEAGGEREQAVPRVSSGSSDDEPEVTEQPTQDDDARALQEENAETSLDQPSS